MILEDIHCIQFYLYEKTTVTLSKTTGIFGPNASGKSSFIDAIQIAMFGGNQNLVTLNAQADDKIKSTRTIKGYCLGQYDAQAHQRVRDCATTYITLIWRDPDTRYTVSMGVCIAASGDDEKHEVLGRYIAEGIEIQLSDHIMLDNGRERPREWKAFRADLVRRMQNTSPEITEIFYDNSERYIKAFMTLMSRGKDISSINLFKRAFRFGLRMRFEKSVDSIVRDEVLESRPTNVKGFKEVTETFRRLRVLVEGVENKIKDGEGIISHFTKADKLEKSVDAWLILENDISVKRILNEVNLAEVELNLAEEFWDKASSKQKDLNKQILELQFDEKRLKLQRDSHAAHNKLALHNTMIESNQKRITYHQNKIKDNRKELYKALIHIANSSEFRNQNEKFNVVVSSLNGIVSERSTQFETEINRAIGLLKNHALKELSTIQNRLNRKLEEKKEERDGRIANIERVKLGKTLIPPHVERLIRHFGNHGIEATPVCDLVKVSDMSWQPVIESFLSEVNLMALLVEETNEVSAFQIYRQLNVKRQTFGIKLLMPSRIKSKQFSQNSVANLIIGENTTAVAFVRNIFGDIQCAETNEEALLGGRTLTRDGMYVGRDTFERLRYVHSGDLRLGIQSIACSSSLREELSILSSEIQDIEKRLNNIEELVNVINAVPKSQNFIDQVYDDLDQVTNYQKDILASKESMVDLGEEEYQALCEDVIQISSQIEVIRKQHIAASKDEGRAEAIFKDKQRVVEEKARNAAKTVEHASLMRKQKVFDSEYVQSCWVKVNTLYKENYNQMLDFCVEKREGCEKNLHQEANRGINELNNFIRTYGDTPPYNIMDEWHQAYDWITGIVELLNNTKLLEYREKMQEAELASQETFRTDVALTLHNNLEFLDQQINRLNHALRRAPTFSNGERYSFKRTVRKEYESLLDFIENIATYGLEEDLFGGPGEVPKQFLSLLDEITEPGSASVRSPIEDYREFFEFDINISRMDELSGNFKVVSQLSKRIGHGSGGEHRAPLYVIAGAALASAYGVDDSDGDGMRLILLDEAFNKMDPQNIIATMRYLESLGLQIFLASPGENLATLTAFMHRYYQILRDAEHNVVLLEGRDISERAREIMRSDLPEFNPALIEQEILIMRQENHDD